jgi:hypothetical protein
MATVRLNLVSKRTQLPFPRRSVLFGRDRGSSKCRLRGASGRQGCANASAWASGALDPTLRGRNFGPAPVLSDERRGEDGRGLFGLE